MTYISTSTSAFYERARFDMGSLRKHAETLQQALSRGQKLVRSSDDPVAASRLRTLARSDRIGEVDTENANRATADLTLAGTTLASIAESIVRSRELAVQASNVTLSDEQRAAIGAELEQIHENLVSLANSRDSSGHALFGGQTPGDAYTVDASGHAVYIGTADSGDLPLGDGQSVKRGLTGPEFLQFDNGGTPTDVMAVVKTLATALQGSAGDPVTAARDALGQLTSGLDTVTTGQTLVGTRMAWIEQTTERQVELAEMRASEEADLGGVDIASTVAELQEALVILEASQASFTRLSGLNLMDQIR